MKTIIFAGGCFWGVEAYFKRLNGVMETTVGYIDGYTENPTYKEVCDGSGHAEAVRIAYDEAKISLETLLDHFFRIVNPTEKDRQGPDIGRQYRNGIFLLSPSDMEKTQNYVNILKDKYIDPIQTIVKMAPVFYEAEAYHQDYLDKVPGGYCHINLNLASNSEMKEEYRHEDQSRGQKRHQKK